LGTVTGFRRRAKSRQADMQLMWVTLPAVDRTGYGVTRFNKISSLALSVWIISTIFGYYAAGAGIASAVLFVPAIIFMFAGFAWVFSRG